MRICRRCGKWFKGTHYETLCQQCRPDPAEAVDWDKVKAETDKVMTRRRFSNRAAGWKGETTICTVRLPSPVVEFIDGCLGESLQSRSECLQEAAFLWCCMIERENA
jgi:hypothetical protein